MHFAKYVPLCLMFVLGLVLLLTSHISRQFYLFASFILFIYFFYSLGISNS